MFLITANTHYDIHPSTSLINPLRYRRRPLPHNTRGQFSFASIDNPLFFCQCHSWRRATLAEDTYLMHRDAMTCSHLYPAQLFVTSQVRSFLFHTRILTWRLQQE